MDNLPAIITEIADLAKWLERNANTGSHAELTEKHLHELIHAAAQAVYYVNRDRE